MGVLSEESLKIISQFKSRNLFSKINFVISFFFSLFFLEYNSITLSTILSEEYFLSVLSKYSIAFATFGILLHSLNIKAFSIVDFFIYKLISFNLLYKLLSSYNKFFLYNIIYYLFKQQLLL